jgi:hypothetical protein
MNALTIFKAPALPPQFQIETTREALAARDEALAAARLLPAVKDADSRQLAVDVMALIARVLNDAEKARKLLKEPFWAAGKAIDAEHKVFSAPLLRGYQALDDQVCDYETAQRELAAQAMRVKSQELKELRESLPAARTPEEQKAQETLLAEKAEELGSAFMPVETAKGQSVTESWDYEVLDLAKLWGTYGARLVELSEKRQAILALINSPDCPTELVRGLSTPRLPGLRVRRVLHNRIKPIKAPTTIELPQETN